MKPHKPGALKRMVIHLHPDGQSSTVEKHFEPSTDRLGAPIFSTGASQDQAFTTRHEMVHHVAQNSGVVSKMVDSPEPDDEADEENDSQSAGVGELGSEKMATKKKVYRSESPNVSKVSS